MLLCTESQKLLNVIDMVIALDEICLLRFNVIFLLYNMQLDLLF